MRKLTIWFNNKFVEAKPVLLKSLTPGILKAKGVFETMRVSKGKVLFMEDHLKRMSRGVKVLGLKRPAWYQRISQNIRELLRMNMLTDARVRVMLWQKGTGVHGAIVVEPFKVPTTRQGFKGMLSNGHKRSTSEPVKSLDYQIFRRSLQKARAAGCDEAILFNSKGELVEGSRTNIFLVKDNVLLTPPVASGCLPGVTRQRVLSRARRLKIRCAAKTLKTQDLLDADEAFVTNALLGIMPLTRLGQKRIGIGKPGPLTLLLRLGLEKAG